MIKLLQINSSKVYDTVLQYGILGIVAIVLSYIAWTQYKSLVEKNEILEKKVDKLQEDMMNLLVEERDQLSTLIHENSKTLRELHNVILTYLLEHQNKD